MTDQSATIERTKELSPKERWTQEISMAEQELKKFHERARKVVKRYLDERDMIQTGNKWFNVFYANTNIMESALYAQIPKPVVSRKFKDYQDDVARVAALMLERSITQDLDDPRDTYDATMRCAVQDRLIPGLAAAWLRLETDTAEIPYEDVTPDQSQPEAPAGYEPLLKITDQRICVDYVFWQDYLFSPCRVWEERRWTGRRVYMDRAKLIKRFGKKLGEAIPLDYTPSKFSGDEHGATPKHEVLKKARIYEIWDRETKTVLWVSKAYPKILDEKKDPLKLVGFEPTPKPMLANITTSNCTPRPDFYMIQDQYTELDTLNNRISMLLQACKVVGTYDKSAEGVSRMLQEGFDNELVPVDNWAAFAEKGGIKGTIDWLPLEVVVAALTQLVQNREIVKQQIYELTGISDIVRGATKASETLGAQELKSKFASMSIKKRQDEVARFAGEILRIKAEMQIKHFSPEMLIKKSNIMSTGQENAQYVEKAIELLKSEEGFEWRIQVSADSIAQADYAMEKADRIEFLTMAGGYIERAGAFLAQKPEAAPLLTSMLKWGVAGFRNAAEIEGILDQELDKMSKAPPPQPKPDPAMQKVQAEMQKMQAEGQIKAQEGQQKMQMEQQKNAATMQLEQQKAQMQLQMMQAELAQKERLNQMEIRMKEMELEFKERELQFRERELGMKMEAKAQEAQLDRETAIVDHELGMEQQSESHAMAMQQQKEAAKAAKMNGASKNG